VAVLYIGRSRSATIQMLHFIYIFSTNISTEYFKRAAHSPFFSSKYLLFHNATFFVPVLFTFYIQGVLNLNVKLLCQKVNRTTLQDFLFFIFAPCILNSILFTHQQMHYLLNLERNKIYTKIHTNIAPTCFGLRPSSAWLKLC
jgi:hypothetical protein